MKKFKKKLISKNVTFLFQNTEIFMYFLGSSFMPLTRESKSFVSRVSEL